MASLHPTHSITSTCLSLGLSTGLCRQRQGHSWHMLCPKLCVPEGFQGSFIFQQAASLPQTSMPSENLWLCDPGRPRRGLSTDALRADVPWAVTDEQHFHCHTCFILVAFPEHPRLRGRRFGSFPAPLRQFGVYISRCWCTHQSGMRRAAPDMAAIPQGSPQKPLAGSTTPFLQQNPASKNPTST